MIPSSTRPLLAAAILLSTMVMPMTARSDSAPAPASTSSATRGVAPAAEQPHPYVGLWVTADRRVRHRLLPNGRYDEARGTRESAYQGRYEVEGDYIRYWDDTGFTADGTFRDDVLYHGGMVFTREEEPR